LAEDEVGEEECGRAFLGGGERAVWGEGGKGLEVGNCRGRNKEGKEGTKVVTVDKAAS